MSGMMKSNKKLTILCILDVLKTYSDEGHPLTHAEILKKLNSVYSVECERKSVGMNIDSLIDYGYDIVKLEKGGCYLNSREFESSEITFLIDAVFASKNISSKHAKDLAKKLGELRSVHEQKQFKYIHKADEITRTVNKNFFLNIEVISEAIENGKAVEFCYNIYDINKKLKSRSSEPYIINPYFMLNNNGKYYLVCNRDGFKNLSNFRLDYITDIRITDKPVMPVTALKGYENGLNIARYANENAYMFGDETVCVKIKLDHDWDISNVLDWFGENVRFYTKNNGDKQEVYAEFTHSERAIIYWSMQYGDSIELISPESTRQKLAEMSERIASKYRS